MPKVETINVALRCLVQFLQYLNDYVCKEPVSSLRKLVGFEVTKKGAIFFINHISIFDIRLNNSV